MKAIIFATLEEAQPFLAAYGRGRFSGLTEGEVLRDESILITAVGVGKIKATLRTERLLRQAKPTSVIHAGTCTALVDDLPNGSLFGVSHVLEGDRIELAAPTYPRMPLTPPAGAARSGTLVTQDHTVIGAQELTYWQRIAQVSDMSGYAIAYVAATHGVPCSILKVVAGRFGQDDADLRRTMTQAHEALAGPLIKLLKS